MLSDDVGQLDQDVREPPQTAERDEPAEASHEPVGPPAPGPHAAPAQLHQEGGAALRQHRLAARGSRGRRARHATLARSLATQKRTDGETKGPTLKHFRDTLRYSLQLNEQPEHKLPVIH